MLLVLSALLIGVVCGLRAMTGPAIISVSIVAGLIAVPAAPFTFMDSEWTAWLFAIAALGELVTDQLPGTPSRKVPLQFVTRIVTSELAAASLGMIWGSWLPGLMAGAAGGVVGTYAGAFCRARMTRLLRNSHVAALIEDGAAFLIGALAVSLAA